MFDTNIFVSALNYGGSPRALFLAACAGEFPLYSSTVLETELLEVLEERFDWESSRLLEVQRRLSLIWTLVEPSATLTDCRDPDDNRVLECAIESGASHIVTGDRALLALDPFRGVRIVSPASFLTEHPWDLAEPD